MESFRIKPESINCAAETKYFGRCQETAVTCFLVFPFAKWVYGYPRVGYAADFDNLFEECKGGSNGSDMMCRLGGIVGKKLNSVRQGPALTRCGCI